MIESVNSAIATSAVSRVQSGQQSSGGALDQEVRTVKEGPRAPYISPYRVYNNDFDRTVLLIRDSETGDVVNQYPTESQLRAYQRAQGAAKATEIPETAGVEAGNNPVGEGVELQSDQQAAQVAQSVASEAQAQTSVALTEAVTIDTQA